MNRPPLAPGVFVEEMSGAPRPISWAPTSTTVFVGRTSQGPPDEPVAVRGWAEYERTFGSAGSAAPLGYTVRSYFRNGGREALIVRRGQGMLTSPADYLGSAADGTGIHALGVADAFGLLCIPPDAPDGDVPGDVYATAAQLCVERRAFLVVDPPAGWAEKWRAGRVTDIGLSDLGTSFSVEQARSAAVYFPRLQVVDPVDGIRRPLAPSGAIAGVIAGTDVRRGVWKSPAGAEAGLSGIAGLEADVDSSAQEVLNPRGINVLRTHPSLGPVVWGARTLRGGIPGDEFRYVAVRRLCLFIEESVLGGTKWVSEHLSEEALWSVLRTSIEILLQGLFREGAFQGSHAREAYFVKCGRDTMSEDDILRGRLVMQVGVAPLRPAEFVVLRFELQAQPAGSRSE